MLDIFRSDAFSVVSLTDSINKQPFTPGKLSAMGLFEEEPISTTSVAMEEMNGTIGLVSPTPRGGPGVTIDKDKRGIRMIAVPHFQIDDAVNADEVQGVRAFGSMTATETVQMKVDARLLAHARRHDLTLEACRVGAVMGIITYADATTLNLFTEFGVTQDTEIAFDLSAASPSAGSLRALCDNVVRAMLNNLQMGEFAAIDVRAIVGDQFWDALIKHPEVRATYLQTQQAADLRLGTAYGAFRFGGILFENYRGAALVGLNTAKAHFYPVGVPGLFKTYFAPADYMETVNTLGLPRYAKQIPMRNDKGIELETQTNPLNVCTRPKALIVGRAGA